MKFIQVSKMNQLREAAKNGDERAKKIIRAQLDGTDFDEDLEAYFAPAPEPAVEEQPAVQEAEPKEEQKKTKLQEFLEANDVKEGDAEYDDFVEDFYKEFPNERKNLQPQGEEREQENADVAEEIDLTKDIAQSAIELVSKCDETLMLILQNDDIDDTTKKGIQTTLQEIKQNTLDNFDKIKKIKASLCKKEEKEHEEETVQEEVL